MKMTDPYFMDRFLDLCIELSADDDLVRAWFEEFRDRGEPKYTPLSERKYDTVPQPAKLRPIPANPHENRIALQLIAIQKALEDANDRRSPDDA
jgi:hypothetical protein